jgi:hypothetical protein
MDAPTADSDHNQQHRPDNRDLEPLPQLLELFSADFFIDFAKDVGHV